MWREVSIGDSCDILDSQRIPLNAEERYLIPGNYPYYGANGVQGYIGKYIFDDKLILMAEDGGYFDEYDKRPIAYQVSGKFWVNNHAHILKAKDHFDQDFVFYSLVHKNIMPVIKGGTRSKLNQSELKEILINAPVSKSIQQKISGILAITDGAVEKTQALITKYENIKQGMMQDLFTRGVDENGQLRPSYEDAPHLYQETELGWVPNDWVTEELRYYVPRAEYGVSIGCDDNAENIPVLRMNNIFNGEFEVSDLKYAPASELSGLLLKEKDVLFNRTNSWEHVGKTAIWKNQLAKASFASYMVRLVPDIDLMMPEYLSYWLQLDDVQTAIRTFATPGVQQVNINPTNLRRTLCSAPEGIDEQKIIVSRVQAIDDKLKKEREILGKLKSQKLGLMQDLLTGKVRVAEDVDERKEAVA